MSWRVAIGLGREPEDGLWVAPAPPVGQRARTGPDDPLALPHKSLNYASSEGGLAGTWVQSHLTNLRLPQASSLSLAPAGDLAGLRDIDRNKGCGTKGGKEKGRIKDLVAPEKKE